MKKFTIFSTHDVGGVKNFKYIYSGFFVVSVFRSVLSSRLFFWFLICGLVQVLFLSLLV